MKPVVEIENKIWLPDIQFSGFGKRLLNCYFDLIDFKKKNSVRQKVGIEIKILLQSIEL